MVAVGEGQGAVIDLMGKEKELSVDPLRVLLEEERGFDKGDGGSTPTRGGRRCGGRGKERGCGVVEVQLVGEVLSLFGHAN